MESYDKVRGSKLVFKGGGLGVDKKISKKSKKKKSKQSVGEEEANDTMTGDTTTAGDTTVTGETAYEIDSGTGHAPDGKKSKKYEELFPVETKRHGYVVPTVDSREAALDERVKKKADRYCK